MNTTPDVTTPLYEGGPSIDDLQAADSLYRISPGYLDDYLESAYTITRADWQTVERQARHDTVALNMRNRIRAQAGMPALSELEAMLDGRNYQATDARDYSDPRYGLPTGVTLEGWMMHELILDRAAVAVGNRGSAEQSARADVARYTCPVCRQYDRTTATHVDPRWHPSTPHYADVRACRPCFAAIELHVAREWAEQRVDKRTRLQLAADYLEGKR